MSKELERRVAALEKIVARQTRELNWLHGALEAVAEGQRGQLEGFVGVVADAGDENSALRLHIQTMFGGHRIVAAHVAARLGGRRPIRRDPYGKGFNVMGSAISRAAARGREDSERPA